MNKYFISFLIPLLCCLGATSQEKNTLVLRVKLADKAGKALEAANILVYRQADSALVKANISNALGVCEFDEIVPGAYYVKTDLLGYKPEGNNAFLIPETATGSFETAIVMEHDANILAGVQVQAHKALVEKKSDRVVLNIENSIVGSGSSALDLVKMAPGVRIDKSDNVLINGKKGVFLLVDGKQTYFTEEQLSNFLKNTPSETIAQIELITNPSARYDAAGNTGIINIRTKKGQKYGFNGSANVTGSYGKKGRFNAGTSVNYRTALVNIYGTFNHSERNPFDTRDLRRYIQTNEGEQLFHQSTHSDNQLRNNMFKVGIDYFLAQRHTLGIMVNGYESSVKRDGMSVTNMGNVAGGIDSILNTQTHNYDKYHNLLVNLNYKCVLDSTGRELNMDADYSEFRNTGALHMQNYLTDGKGANVLNDDVIRNSTLTHIYIRSIKADFVQPLGKDTRLDMGAKYSSVRTSNDLNYDSLINGQYVHSVTQSADFIYKEKILAGYATFNTKWNKTAVSGGIRVEHTQSDGNSATLQEEVKRDYTNVFPSLTIEQELNENNVLSLALNRRIDRPGYQDLNPFLFFLDKFTYISGNPFLKPQYTNNIELGYTFRSKYYASLAYSRTSDVILEYLQQNDSTKITIDTKRNFNSLQTVTLALNIPVDIAPWWSTSNSINLSYNKYSINATAGVYAPSRFSYDIKSTQLFKMGGGWKSEVSAGYYSPFIDGIFNGQSQCMVAAGVQKSILGNKADVKLSVKDIFANGRFYGTARYSNLNMVIRNRYESRMVVLAFSWRFGNNNVKAARERSSGVAGEQNRIKTGN